MQRPAYRVSLSMSVEWQDPEHKGWGPSVVIGRVGMDRESVPCGTGPIAYLDARLEEEFARLENLVARAHGDERIAANPEEVAA